MNKTGSSTPPEVVVLDTEVAGVPEPGASSSSASAGTGRGAVTTKKPVWKARPAVKPGTKITPKALAKASVPVSVITIDDDDSQGQVSYDTMRLTQGKELEARLAEHISRTLSSIGSTREERDANWKELSKVRHLLTGEQRAQILENIRASSSARSQQRSVGRAGTELISKFVGRMLSQDITGEIERDRLQRQEAEKAQRVASATAAAAPCHCRPPDERPQQRSADRTGLSA